MCCYGLNELTLLLEFLLVGENQKSQETEDFESDSIPVFMLHSNLKSSVLKVIELLINCNSKDGICT